MPCFRSCPSAPPHTHTYAHTSTPSILNAPLLPPAQVQRVSVEAFEELMVGGDMLLPSVTTGFLALRQLRQRGLI